MPRAYALYVDVIPPGGGRISVGHIFYGATEAEARANFEAHAKGCHFLRPAIEEGRIAEELETIKDSEWPDYPEDDEEDDAEDDDEVIDLPPAREVPE